MSELSLPFGGTTVGDAGPYTDAEWQQAWANLAIGGLRGNIGPILGGGAQPYNSLRVQARTPASTIIDVLSGSALVQGVLYINTGTVSFTVAANASGNPRIDLIVVQLDYTLQITRLALKQGTPAATPVPPTLTQTVGVMWEIPIGEIAIANGFVTLAQSTITPRHEWVNAAPGVYLDNIVNNSGADLQTGDVVIWDSTADRAVTITNPVSNPWRDEPKTAGVWVGRTANGGYGRMLVRGVGYVRTSAAVTRGNQLVSSTTAKQAVAQNGYALRGVGIALETTSGSGLATCHVDISTTGPHYMLFRDEKAQNTAGGTFTSGAWQTRTLTTEVVDTDDDAVLAANQITLQPGTYRVAISAPAYIVALHQTRLQNITDNVTLLWGTSEAAAQTNQTGRSFIIGRFTILAAKVLEVQHRCSSTGTTNGFGLPANFGTEIYTIAEFWREA